MTKFSPETVAFSVGEIDDLCVMDSYKELDSLIISTEESSPAQGVDEDYGEDGLYIDIGDTSHIILHVVEVTGPQQVRRQLVQAATYMNLHPEYRSNYQTVLGVTYRQLGNFAVRRFGFRAIEPSAMNPASLKLLTEVYNLLPLSKNVPFSPLMVYMPVDEFIDRYAAKYLGTDPDELCNRIESGQPLPQPQTIPRPPDSTVSAIRRMLDTM